MAPQRAPHQATRLPGPPQPSCGSLFCPTQPSAGFSPSLLTAHALPALEVHRSPPGWVGGPLLALLAQDPQTQHSPASVSASCGERHSRRHLQRDFCSAPASQTPASHLTPGCLSGPSPHSSLSQASLIILFQTCSAPHLSRRHQHLPREQSGTWASPTAPIPSIARPC